MEQGRVVSDHAQDGDQAGVLRPHRTLPYRLTRMHHSLHRALSRDNPSPDRSRCMELAVGASPAVVAAASAAGAGAGAAWDFRGDYTENCRSS
jgi:hypothetical protein